MGRIGRAGGARRGAPTWGVDPSAIPGKDIDVAAVREAAAALVSGAREVRDTGADVRRAWQRLGDHYEAPEAAPLLVAMDPVERETRQLADAVELVARALRTYADEVEPVARRLAALRARAWALDSRMRRTPGWRDDPALVADAARLIGEVRHAERTLADAEERCAATIRAADGAPPPTCGPVHAEPVLAVDGGWGSASTRREACARVIGDDALSYVDGVVGDGIIGGWLTTASHAGLSLDGFSLETMEQAWSGYADLAVPGSAIWLIRRPDPAATTRAWRGAVDGVLMAEMWAENPARAAGAATFAIATAFVPGGGLKSAAQGAAAAARAGGRAARVADAAADAGRTAAASTAPTGVPLVLKEGAQNKHIRGHPNFESYRGEITADPVRLIERAGSGEPANKYAPGTPGYRERVHYDEIIGIHADRSGVRSPTSVGILHYAKKGIHVVPGAPQP